jgi:serine/threonine protein phosphatase PrpC
MSKSLNVYEDHVMHRNEDRHFRFDVSSLYLCIGVADGHGGFAAADVCKNNISRLLKTQLECGNTVDESIEATFHKLHELCLSLPCNSGCTLTVVIIHKHTMDYICVNVGDSFGLHITPTTHMWITTSHRLQDNVSEREKLKKHISFIKNEAQVAIGPPRLFPGGLACSRSIGDADCPFVSCVPSVYHGQLAEDDILFIASDGVWDCVTCNRVVKILRDTCNPENIKRHIQKNVVRDDASLIVVSTQKSKQTMFNKMFYRNNYSSSNSSLSDEDIVHPTIVKVPLA